MVRQAILAARYRRYILPVAFSFLRLGGLSCLSPETPVSFRLVRSAVATDSVCYDAEGSPRALPRLAGARGAAPEPSPTISTADFGGADDQPRVLRGRQIIG